MNLLSLIVIPYNRVKHLIAEFVRINQLEKTIESIRNQHKNAKDKGMEHYERIYNVSLYLLIFEYDIAILRNDALFSIRRWKKGFVARQMAILLYEASQDIPNLLGKEFRISLQEIGATDDELKEFNTVTKAINKFKNDHRDMLQKLRNFAGAHRDKEAALQLKIIEEVDLLSVMELAGDFYESIRDLIPFMINLIKKMGNWRVLIKHIEVEK